MSLVCAIQTVAIATNAGLDPWTCPCLPWALCCPSGSCVGAAMSLPAAGTELLTGIEACWGQQWPQRSITTSAAVENASGHQLRNLKYFFLGSNYWCVILHMVYNRLMQEVKALLSELAGLSAFPKWPQWYWFEVYLFVSLVVSSKISQVSSGTHWKR